MIVATEYKLSYTASEINEKLRKVDNIACVDETLTKSKYAADAKITGDYLTRLNDDVVNIKANMITTLAQPSFYDSFTELEQYGDTDKVYVLSDGYIYAYSTELGLLFTNQLANAVDTDGTTFNGGLGYKEGYLNSSNQTSIRSQFNEMYSGYIPYTVPNKIIITGVQANADMSTSSYQKGKIMFFDSSNTLLHHASFNELVAEGSATFDGEGYNGYGVLTFDFEAFGAAHSYWYTELPNSCTHIRIAWQIDCSPNDAYVLFDEELGFGILNEWVNTGLLYNQPADYEDRVITVETTVAEHEDRLEALENDVSYTDVGIPTYIKNAANEVIDKVIEKQGNRSFNMIALSDFHYNNWGDGNSNNLARACMAISYIKSRINIDAIATLGDNTPYVLGYDDVIEKVLTWFKEVNEILEMTQGNGIINFRTVGNHDRLGGTDEDGTITPYIPDNAIYSYINGYSRGLKMGDVPGGYGYYDFDSYKLRVIMLNTCECDGIGRFSSWGSFHMTAKQYNWLIDTLDLTDKSDASEWQIVLLSHHSADNYQEITVEQEWTNGFILPNILNAYNTGGSYTGTGVDTGVTISCDFGGKNAAKLIGSIHGHNHSYTFGDMYLGDKGASNTFPVKHISTPTTGFITDGNYDNDGVKYTSVAGTAEETAFCVYSIDLDNHVIHAIHYGNGLDREIEY